MNYELVIELIIVVNIIYALISDNLAAVMLVSLVDLEFQGS